MRCTVTYTDPSDGTQSSLVVEHALNVGRNPGPGGLALDTTDTSISSVAAVIRVSEAGATIDNTSSFAQIDVLQDGGVRFLFPGEAIQVRTKSTLVVPGTTFNHRIEIEPTGTAVGVLTQTGTQPLKGHLVIADERLPTLAGLCAARFYPDRFGVSLLAASAVADLVTAAGDPVTSKAVNNKIQRTRDQIAAQHGVFLDSREDLAEFLIRGGHIRRSHVDALLNAPGECSRPARDGRC